MATPWRFLAMKFMKLMKRGFKANAALVFAGCVVILFGLTAHGQNAAGLSTPTPAVQSQPSVSNDPVIQKMWVEGQDKSQPYPVAQELLDLIGPRLTGSAEQKRATDWAVAQYRKWGLSVRAEPYGTWMGWRRGIAHVDLIAPR